MSPSFQEALSKVSEAAKLLLGSGHDAQTINSVLDLVGLVLDVDRIYVFENKRGSLGELLASQRYEWVTRRVQGISTELQNPVLQDLSYADFIPFWVKPLSEGRSDWRLVKDLPSPARELMEHQGIKSLLLCPIIVKEQWWGFVGFDDCHQERRWSTEVPLLEALARALAGSLRHEQLRRKLMEAHKALWHFGPERKRSG
jgi:GAF domain-containing protein